MKIKRIMVMVAVLAITACCVGCGSAGSSGGTDDISGSEADDTESSGMSESEAIALSEQISKAASESANQSLQAESTKTVQCNPDTSTCTYNIPISYRLNCTAGGMMEVTGSITGTSTNGSGILQIGAQETITDWECITGYIVNGDPYISLSGTFTFLNGNAATQQSMTISGGFKWGATAAESCQIYLSIDYNSDGSGRMTGSVCGYAVDADV